MSVSPSIRWTVIALATLAVGCSHDDGVRLEQAPPEDATVGVVAEDGGSGDAAGMTIGICSELGETLDFEPFLAAFTAPDDCRVSHLYMALQSANEIEAYVDAVFSFTGGFLGCEGMAPVVSFVPAELPGVAVPLTQADVEVILDHYVVALVKTFDLTAEHEQRARGVLTQLAKSAVEDASPGHSLSLCPEDGGADSGVGAPDGEGGGG